MKLSQGTMFTALVVGTLTAGCGRSHDSSTDPNAAAAAAAAAAPAAAAAAQGPTQPDTAAAPPAPDETPDETATVAPPVPQVETPPPAPNPEQIWVAGSYKYEGTRYVWAPGHYEPRRTGYDLVQPRWAKSGTKWVHLPMRWVAHPGAAPAAVPARAEPPRPAVDPHRPAH